MKKKTLYECEKCHTNYANVEDAKRCEKSHSNVLEFSNFRYTAMNAGDCTYPVTIDVLISDRHAVRYHR